MSSRLPIALSSTLAVAIAAVALRRPGGRAGPGPDPGQVAARPAAGRRNPDHFQRPERTAGPAGAAGLAGNLPPRRPGAAAGRRRRRCASSRRSTPPAARSSASPARCRSAPLLTFLLRSRLGPGPAGARVFGAARRAAHCRGAGAAADPGADGGAVEHHRAPAAVPPTPIADAARPSPKPTPPPKPPSGQRRRHRRRSRRSREPRRRPTPVAAAAPMPTPRRPLRPVKAGQTLARSRDRVDPGGYSAPRRCSRCCAPTPMPSSAATSTGSSRRRAAHAAGAGELARVDRARPRRWCTSRSRSGARCARTVPQPAAVATAPADARRPRNHRPRRRNRPHAQPARGWKSRRRRQRRADGQAHNPASKPVARARCCDSNCRKRRKTLAARDAEVNELKTRVAELEKLQQQQQQLITHEGQRAGRRAADARQANATPQRRSSAPPSRNAAARRNRAAGNLPARHVWLWGGVALLRDRAGRLAADAASPAKARRHRGAASIPRRCGRHSGGAGRRSRRTRAMPLAPDSCPTNGSPRPINRRAEPRRGRRRRAVRPPWHGGGRRPSNRWKPPSRRRRSNSSWPRRIWTGATTMPRAYCCATCWTAAIRPRATWRRALLRDL